MVIILPITITDDQQSALATLGLDPHAYIIQMLNSVVIAAQNQKFIQLQQQIQSLPVADGNTILDQAAVSITTTIAATSTIANTNVIK